MTIKWIFLPQKERTSKEDKVSVCGKMYRQMEIRQLDVQQYVPAHLTFRNNSLLSQKFENLIPGDFWFWNTHNLALKLCP